MAKKAKVKTARVTPTYLSSKASFKMGLEDVVRALKVIEENDHLDKFIKAAKRNKASVSVDGKTVNFVKDFMVKYEMHDHPVGKHIVNASVDRDRFRPCSFGRRG